MEQFFGYFALVTTIVGLVPQVYKSYKTKSTSDISYLMLLNYLIGSLSWIVYGFSIGSKIVLWSNILGAITSSISLVQKKLYDRP